MDRICFIHRGRAPFLRHAVAQAQHAGLIPIVIGDEEATENLTCQCHDISKFNSSAERFATKYRHFGVNPEMYELFCIQRWFIIYEYLEYSNGPIWMADHDILVYDGISHIAETLRSLPGHWKPMMNSAWFTYIHDRKNVTLFIDFIVSIYNDTALLEEAAERNAINQKPHLSDMHLLIDCAIKFPNRFLDTAHNHPNLGLDINIRNIDGFIAESSQKSLLGTRSSIHDYNNRPTDPNAYHSFSRTIKISHAKPQYVRREDLNGVAGFFSECGFAAR